MGIMTDLQEDLAKRAAAAEKRAADAAANHAAERAAALAQAVPPEPLEPVKVNSRDLKTGRMVEIGVAMRRQSDARLWAWLEREADFVRAVDRIMRAYSSFSALPGLQQAKAANWQRGRIDSTPDHDAGTVDLMAARADYYEWIWRCDSQGIVHAAIMDVLAHGLSLRAVERARQRRNGWARDQMGYGLALYCTLKGWRKAA